MGCDLGLQRLDIAGHFGDQKYDGFPVTAQCFTHPNGHGIQPALNQVRLVRPATEARKQSCNASYTLLEKSRAKSLIRPATEAPKQS